MRSPMPTSRLAPAGIIRAWLELFLGPGPIQGAYTRAFWKLRLRFDLTAPSDVRIVADPKQWFSSLDAEMLSALEGLSDADFEKTIPRGSHNIPLRTMFCTFREAILIVCAKVNVYFHAMGKAIPTQNRDWIGRGSRRPAFGRLPRMEWLADPATWTAFITLFVLEVVLGVDNVIFLSILSSKLPADQQQKARQYGLFLAGGMRLLLLFSISIIIQLKTPLFDLPIVNQPISGKDIILILGGLFLMYKATKEIHDKLEGEEGHVSARVAPTFAAVLAQVMLLDLVFSIDSVITAVGMADRVEVMVAAIVAAVGVMLFASNAIFTFVNRHPSVKVLALAFLLLIGVSLMAEGFEAKIPKGYIYFAMAFTVFVELVNIRSDSRKSKPVVLRAPVVEDAPRA